MSETQNLARIAALETELTRGRRLLDTLGKESPTGDTVNGEGIYAMASRAGFIHSYGSSIWIGGKDCTESVHRLAMMVAQAENEECAKVCDDHHRPDADLQQGIWVLGTAITLAAAIRKRYER